MEGETLPALRIITPKQQIHFYNVVWFAQIYTYYFLNTQDSKSHYKDSKNPKITTSHTHIVDKENKSQVKHIDKSRSTISSSKQKHLDLTFETLNGVDVL